MARTTNEFGGGEIVPAIEAITGIQAPVMADFVAVPFGTVNHEHGERRQIQNQINNLKSSSGIERIPFNGIDELDTEQGPNGEAVHALNTGDSRIRFVGNGWEVFTNAARGTHVRTAGTSDYIEITFFGTGLNILTATNSGDRTIIPVVDGVTGTDIYPGTFSDVLEGQNVRTDQILPVRSGLTAGVHTIRLSQTNASTGTRFVLYGIEVINENAAITQQSGADFDGRVEALSGTTFPIKPDNSSISAVNSRTGVSEAFTGTTGARVLNYITSGGQFKQSFDIADEAPVASGSSTGRYTIQLNVDKSVTIPTNVTSFALNAFGGAGGGGGGRINTISIAVASGGGGGGGAGQAQATFVRDTSTQAETVSVSIGAGGGGGAGSGSGIGQGVGGTNGNNTIVSVGGTTIATGNGSSGGNGAFFSGGNFPGSGGSGASGSSSTFTGWSISAQSGISGATGGGGNVNGGADGTSQSAIGGGGGNVGGQGNTPLMGSEGAGGTGVNAANGNSGNVPGGGGAGGGATISGGSGTGFNGATGADGRVYLIIDSSSTTLTNTDFGVTAGELTNTEVLTGIVPGSATAIFGNAAFDTNRLNQEVIRRINFREFGANNAFTVDSTSTSTAFTLDDGTTTLAGLGVSIGSVSGGGGTTTIVEPSLWLPQTASYFTITFVGTGLDITRRDDRNGGTPAGGAWPVAVDGFIIGGLPNGTSSTNKRIEPIVSGLAYGTHTVSFGLNTVSSFDYVLGFQDFIIYGPKKPEIPTLDDGALELSDYNIMADYVPLTTNPQTGTISQREIIRTRSLSKGTLAKVCSREYLYSGATSASFTRVLPEAPWGQTVVGNTPASGGLIVDYTFYGTGVELFGDRNTNTPPVVVSIDGNVINATNYNIQVTVNGGTPTTRTTGGTRGNIDIGLIGGGAGTTNQPSFTTASGTWVLSAEDSQGQRIQITAPSTSGTSDLDLGVHTAQLSHTNATPSDAQFDFAGGYVITPIHINEDNLKIGSEGLNNLTVDPVVEEDEQVTLANLGEAKAWGAFDNNGTVLVRNSHNVSAIIQVNTETLNVYFDKPFKNQPIVVMSSDAQATTLSLRVSDLANNGTGPDNHGVRLTTTNDTTVDYISFAAYGELIDE